MEPNPTPQPQAPVPPSNNAPSNNSGMGVLAYLGVLIIIPFLTDSHKDPFVKFHIKQGLVLIIMEVIATFLNVIPFLGWLIGFVLWIAALVFIITGIMNVLAHREKELPIIGKYARNFNF
jgi:uncharacterized membrane protein